jgi:hypothetical protein
MSTTSDALRTPALGSKSSASVRLKIVAAAPIPIARDAIDVTVNTGLRPRRRTACLRSVRMAMQALD